MSDIMHIGISALAAYQTALTVASQNIANADTPYYSRRQIQLTENPFMSGVNVADIRRIFSETANRYAQDTNSEYSKWDTYYQQFSGFEKLFDDGSINVGKFITDSLNALQQIGNNFTSSSRTLYMNKLVSLTSEFQSVNEEMNKQILNTNVSLENQVTQVNSIMSSIANINRLIMHAGNAEHPELLDQRESLVQDLSQFFNFNTSLDENGLVQLSLSNGMPILSGERAYTFTTLTDPSNTANLIIGINDGNTTQSIQTLIEGGQMAGLMNFRQNGLASTQAALGRLALVISQTLNQQNKLGINASANLGSNIFTDINTSTMMLNRVTPYTTNSGSANMSVTIDDVSQLNTSNYKMSINASNGYSIVRASDNTVVSTGTLSTFPTTISLDGFSLTVSSGTFTAGDQYTISPTHGAADNIALAISDPSQLALGWPVSASSGTKHAGSNGSIQVDSIVDTTNTAFSTARALNPPIEIRFTVSGGVTTYSLYNATTSAVIESNIPYVDGQAIFPTPGNYDPGYRASISGSTIQDGDTFNITYNLHPEGDNRNARALVAAYQKGSILGVNNQLVNFSDGYIMVSSEISQKTNESLTRYQTSLGYKQQADSNREMISGVNLEEESLNLSNFQVAYQASAQVLQVARSVMDIISSIARG